MADASALDVHDMQVSEATTFGQGGNITRKTRVTFFVGTHGPFIREYDPGQATSAKIQSDINAQVQLLRILTGAGG